MADRLRLDKLPRDVLVQVAEILRCTSPASLIQLGHVNSLFHRLARYSQHFCVTLELSASEQCKLLQRLAQIRSEGMLSAVKEVVIKEALTERGASDLSYTRSAEQVASFLTDLSGLRDVVFQGMVLPMVIRDTMQNLPRVFLHTSMTKHTDPRQPEPHLGQIHNLANLHSLEVKIMWFKPSDCRVIMRPLKSLLLTCPGLASLSLTVSHPSLGSFPHGSMHENTGLDFQDGEKPPALSELTLIGYPFWSSSDSNSMRKSATDAEYPREIDYWAHTFDWSKLKCLKTNDLDFAIRAHGRFTVLEQVTLDVQHRQNVSQFFEGLNASLHKISVPALHSIGTCGILRHASTLQKLSIHCSESSVSSWRDRAVTAEALQIIIQTCGLLTSLTLDVGRDGVWPYAMFDILISAPKLEILHMHMELGIANPEHPVEPHVTFDASKHIFEYLTTKPDRRAPRLRMMTISTDVSLPTGIGLSMFDANWALSNGALFECQLSERDDERSVGIFIVTTPKVKGHRHMVVNKTVLCSPPVAHIDKAKASRLAQLRKVFTRSKQSRTRRNPDSAGVLKRDAAQQAWIVAHNGPMPLHIWKAQN